MIIENTAIATMISTRVRPEVFFMDTSRLL
jgi:hypothetical protein